MSAVSGLLIAVFAISWASIMVRWCGDVPAVVISFYRMFWSSLLFYLFYLARKRTVSVTGGLSARHKRLVLLAGLMLALHFVTWIGSVQQTLISHALILGSTHPLFALLLSPFFLKERGGWKSVAAALLTLTGIALIGAQDVGISAGRLTGDLLAVASALFITFYIFIARHLREKIDILPYLIAVYGAAGLFLLPVIPLSGAELTRYPWQTHLVMFLLALVPTGIGHSLINWAARKIPAYQVNFSILGEPVFASLLAFFIFGEKPYGWFYPGAVLIVAGIFLALSDRRKQPLPEDAV